LTEDSGQGDLTQKEEGRKAVKRTQVKVNKISSDGEKREHAILKHWDLQLQLFVPPDLDDVVDPMLNLPGRQFFLGIALGIINSAILAH
jgi:hypothetical protein